MKRFLNKLFSVLMAFTLVFLSMPLTAFTTEETICTFIDNISQLQEFAAKVNNGKTYKNEKVVLTSDITLNGENYQWTPIGANSAFEGTFDGNYHVINGIFIESGSSIGLFGDVNGGTIKNLIVRGEVTGSSNVAGIVGKLTSGRIENCGNEATVSGATNVGGVVGSVNGDCTITGCYNSGPVSGTTGYIGGVTGQHWRAGTVENCYNVGTVSGPATVGGVTGGHKRASVSISNCYNAASVIDTAEKSNNIGAVIGALDSSSENENANCYYVTGTGTNKFKGITAVDTLNAQSLGAAFKADSDDLNNGYPVLTWQISVCNDTPVRPAFIECTDLSAQLADYIKAAINSSKKHSDITGTLLGNSDYLSGASSTATDWMALAMGRFGYFDSEGYHMLYDDGTGYEDYLSALKLYIESTYSDNNGKLHNVKATEWHRAVVTIAALGGDPTNFGKYNNEEINLIADGSYNNTLRAGPGTQGINGWIWGLIAMDTGMYDLPSNAKYTRETFIKEILKMQLTDGVNGNTYGGWVLGGYGSSSDTDITAMAVQALAPYYNDDTTYTYINENSKSEVKKTVRQCVDEALDRLGTMFNKNGGFTSWNTENVESISQVIVALCSLGINPAEDSRFITADGTTLLDGMLRFCLPDGGFCHVLNGGWNSMANDQATYALVSYWRLENKMRTLYDMRNDFSEDDTAAINIAIEAIDATDPTSDSYKEQLKNALEKFRSVTVSERRYVSNYSMLSYAINMVGGESALDTDDPYIVSIDITNVPKKTVYTEGETFDPNGMVVTATYNNNEKKVLSDYKILSNGQLEVSQNKIYIEYGALKTYLSIEVREKMPWTGEGNEDSPFIIQTSEDLIALAERVNSGKTTLNQYFLMTSNIDLSDCDNWTSIGKRYQFQGTFDGGYFSIDNLNSANGGLFGYLGNSAIIRNVGVSNGTINAANTSFVGGIAGWSNGADIINCWNGADIICNGWSGGIVGTIRDGGESSVMRCYNSGAITASNGAVGGIIGHLGTSGNGTEVNVTVSDCYNIGAITAKDNAGGIVGRAQDGHIIKNCYNNGEVIVTGNNVIEGAGAIASLITNDNEIINSYYNTDINNCGVSNGDDNAIGKSSLEMKSQEFLSAIGEAFRKDSYELVNCGYPILNWQKNVKADEINKVISLIDTIGIVTSDSGDKIYAAKDAYDNLDENLKKFVSNAPTLEKAELELKSIQTLIQAQSSAVKQLENYKDFSDYREEQQSELLQVILEGRKKINSASDVESVYFALDESKAMIDSIKTDEQISDEENAKKVSDKIASIGIVTFDSENTILNIRMEYNALSDGSKNLVSNYEILVKAEQRLEELKKQSNSNGSDNGISDNTDNQNPNDNSTNAPKTGINLSIEFCLIFMILSFGGFVAVKKAKEAQEN